MKLTKNQIKIKKYAETMEMNIITTIDEKNNYWDNENLYDCDNCGKYRKVCAMDDGDDSICKSCFNKIYRLPFFNYNKEFLSIKVADYIWSSFIFDRKLLNIVERVKKMRREK